VLFACLHNAGRSQMAAGLMRRLAAGRVEVLSAGSEPAGAVHPVVLEAMREVGVDIDGQVPRALSDLDVQAADVVVTMGCGDACPVYPGKRYLDWDLEDPAGMDPAGARGVRDDIANRVRDLMAELGGL